MDHYLVEGWGFIQQTGRQSMSPTLFSQCRLVFHQCTYCDNQVVILQILLMVTWEGVLMGPGTAGDPYSAEWDRDRSACCRRPISTNQRSKQKTRRFTGVFGGDSR